ncbi:MAG: hypothetical protein ABI183_16230 [Polyangiaceae bacterium]
MIVSKNRIVVVYGLVLGLAACSSSGDGDGPSNFVPGNPQPILDAGGVGSSQALSGNDGDGGTSATDAAVVFYANSDTTLYQLDPKNLSAPMTTIGQFDCVPSGTTVMTDIAVSKTGKVYGVSAAAAWPITITGSTVHCDAKWPLSYDTHFNGLTFAPENTVAAEEVLIGGNAKGELWSIDTGTGASTQIGTLGIDSVSGLPWTISGDMVFMANGGNPIGFASVRTCPAAAEYCSDDSLMEIDVKALKPGTQSVMKSIRGAVTRGSWCTNSASPSTFGSIFGVIAYQDKVYGFSRHGDFIEMHNDDGSGCLVDSNPGVAFAGSGITTIAPVTAPPPR